MSNSEDDSIVEVENKDTVQLEDSPQLKSVCKSLNTDSASPNAKGDQASIASSYSEPETEKIGIKADLPNIGRVSGNRRKNSTKTAQETTIESVSRRNRKASCKKDSGGRCKDSKKISDIKPSTSKRISEDKCSSHISDISRDTPSASKIKTRLISDASTSAPTDKSVYKQTVSKYEVESKSPKKSESCVRPTKCDEVQRELHTTVESKKLDIAREVASAEKAETSTNATANEYIGSENRHYNYSPGTYFAEPVRPVRRKSVKNLVEEFEYMISLSDCQNKMERKQKSLGKSENKEQRISDIATKRSLIRPEKVQSSSTPKTSFSFESSFVSPENVQASSKINASSERISPLISTEKARLESETRNSSLLKSYLNLETDKAQSKSNARISLPNEMTSLTSPEKTQPGFKTSLPNESTQLSSPEKGQLSFRERISFLNEVTCPLISPEVVQSCSRTNLSNEKISPLISTEKAQLGSRTRISPLIGPEKNKQSETKIIIPDERTSLISPEKFQLSSEVGINRPNEKTSLSSTEKAQLSSRSQINLLNEKTLPKTQPENFAVQSDAGKAAVAASDVQPSIQEQAIPVIRTLKHENVLKSSSNERQKESKQTDFLGSLLLERKDSTQFSLEFQEPIVIEHLRSNTETETPKDSTERGQTLRSKANTSGEISSPSSSIGPAESVFHENQLDVGSKTTPVSHMQSPVVPGGSRSKVNIGVRSRTSRTYFEQQDTFEESLDSLDFITVRGMKKLDVILEEMEKRCSRKFSLSDWVDSTEEIQETELDTLGEMSRILKKEFEETQKEKQESASHPCNTKSPEDGSETATVEQLQTWKSKSGSEQEKGSSDQQAGGELDKVDLPARPKSPRALFEILQAIKIDSRLAAWMELLRIFYRIGIIHTSNELKTVLMRMYDEKVVKKFFDYHLTHRPETRRSSVKGGYFEENDLFFRRLRLITSRMGKMTMAMIWLDICERVQKVRHDREQLREEKTTRQNVGLPPPLNIDSSNENRRKSRSDSPQKSSSKEPRKFSSQKLQEHVKIHVGDEEPKQIDQLHGKVSGSKPTSKIVSSKESSLEKVTPQFNRVCKENLLLRELMRRKRTSSPFQEDGKVPAVDSVASPRIGSGGDLLSKCSPIKEKDPSGDTASKHSDAQEDSGNNLNLHRLPLDEPGARELLQIFDKIIGDIFSVFIQSNMNNF